MGNKGSWQAVALATFWCITLMLPGCSERGGGTRFGNLAPETVISIGPKEESCNHYKVKAYWYGTDLDGRVERFEIATLRGIELGLFTMGDYDSLPWVRTTSTESTFVLVTDSCCASEGDEWFATSSWVLFVRAVDNNWAKDPEPATLAFETCNVVPKVEITFPEKLPLEYMQLPSHPRIEWQGQDADGNYSELMYKYIAIPEADMNPDYPRLPPLDQDSSGVDYQAPLVGDWSKWVPADCTYVEDLDLSPFVGLGTDHLLRVYVTVKDEGEAILPEMLYPTYNDSSNYLRFLVVE